jgi:sugar phosphate isomerase/epimerase
MAIPFALQLYTVRDHLEKDVPGTLKQVKEMGYDYVETAGTVGLTTAEFRQVLDDAGLTAISAHLGHEDVPAIIDAAKTLGVECAVCGVHFEGGGTRDDWAGAGRTMKASGAQLREAGIQLCYHNHAHEFVTVDGEHALDIMFNAATPETLASELDLYWVKYGEQDPLGTLKKYAGRCPLLHIKDMAAGADRAFAEVGQGIIDWVPIFEVAPDLGVKWFIVEQDICPGDSLESARISAEFMARQ